MKEKFKGYYKPTQDEFAKLWNKCIFIFDTNILLNIYRYSESTRVLFLDILTKLKDRIWLPYQVAQEFHERRLEVIKEQQDAYDDIIDILQNNKDHIE
jgi:hypothetical protein